MIYQVMLLFPLLKGPGFMLLIPGYVSFNIGLAYQWFLSACPAMN